MGVALSLAVLGGLTAIPGHALAPPATGATVASATASHGRIVFDTFDPSGGDGTTIEVIDGDGGTLRRLLDYGGAPRWSPDGSTIAVGGCDPAVAFPCTTTVIDPTGSVVRQLPLPARLGARRRLRSDRLVARRLPVGRRRRRRRSGPQRNLDGPFI